MGCGSSQIEKYFEIKLYNLKTTSKNDYLIIEVTSDLLLMVDKKNLPMTILSHNKKSFFDYFETTESIKDCAFIIIYDNKKLKYEILSHESCTKLYPIEKYKRGDIILKVYVINIKEHGIQIDNLSSLDLKNNLENQTIKTNNINNKIKHSQQEIEEVIEGETYEEDKVEVNGIY